MFRYHKAVMRGGTILLALFCILAPILGDMPLMLLLSYALTGLELLILLHLAERLLLIHHLRKKGNRTTAFLYSYDERLKKFALGIKPVVLLRQEADGKATEVTLLNRMYGKKKYAQKEKLAVLMSRSCPQRGMLADSYPENGVILPAVAATLLYVLYFLFAVVRVQLT